MVSADTGFWVALASPRDAAYARAHEALRQLGTEQLIVTWPVIAETCHLLSSRVGWRATSRFLASHAAGAYTIADPGIHPPERMLPLMERYRDLPMDVADASLVLLAHHLGHGRILSTDRRDFETYRWKERHPFDNLMAR
ncbi:MAG: type II toxin-antitoxin system VapC family toxin [Myxococcota bacterium]